MSADFCAYCNEKPKFMDEKGKAYSCSSCGLDYDRALEASELYASCLPLPKPMVAGWLRKIYNCCGKTFASMIHGAKPKEGPVANDFKGCCAFPGCALPYYVNASGATSLYCSPAHQQLAQAPTTPTTPNSCLQCHVKERQNPSIFCSPECTAAAANSARTSVLIQLQAGHSVYSNVVNQFCKTWSSNANVQPTIYHVYKIIYNQESYSKYIEYRKKMDAKGQHTATGQRKGNETRRFYGTKRECTLGDVPGDLSPCESATCSLCSIIRHSFDVNKVEGTHSLSRNGISVSSTSSTGDSHSVNPASEYKAMLLARVVLGKEKGVTAGSQDLTVPPAGFDSVVEVGAKGPQNNKEAIVYDNDAIRPSYLVIYKS